MASTVVCKYIGMRPYWSNGCTYYWSEVFYNNVAFFISPGSSNSNQITIWHLDLKNFRETTNSKTICDYIFGWFFISSYVCWSY